MGDTIDFPNTLIYWIFIQWSAIQCLNNWAQTITFLTDLINLDSRVLSYLTLRSRGWAEQNPRRTIPTVYYVELY